MLDGYNFQLNDYHNPDHYTTLTDQKTKADASYSIQTCKYEQGNKQPTSDSSYQT